MCARMPRGPAVRFKGVIHIMIEYHISADEEFYVEGFKRFRASKKLRYVFTFVKTIGLLIFSFAIWALFSKQAYGLASSAIVFSLIIVFGHKIDQYILKRNVRKSPHVNEELVVSFSEEGFHAKSETTDMKLKWNAFTNLVRVEDGFLLFQGPKFYNWLPDKSLSDPSKLEAIRELLEKNV